jgi:GT2 family glycosyltransferase
MITIAIPTYNRGEILVATIGRLLALEPAADAIIIADQTAQQPVAVERRLHEWNASGAIRWLRFERPSIPHAMNEALLASTTDLVLFLDDDIEPSPSLVGAHVEAHRRDPTLAAVVGQILQPGQRPQHHPRPTDDLEFRFNHDEGCTIRNAMAGNLSVHRSRAIEAGGFDENFVGVAYRFETDFALRLVSSGGRIRFDPAASIHHLQFSTGGLRAYGDFRTSPSPMHSAGDYYFALRHHLPFMPYAMRRLQANVVTRFHLRHPWTIPAKVIGELRGMLLARALHRRGPRLIGKAGNLP